MKNFHTLTIKPASNGIEVKAGCLLIVYQQSQITLFINDLRNYLDDPIGTEKMIRDRWVIGGDASEDTVANESEARARPSREERVKKEEEKSPR